MTDLRKRVRRRTVGRVRGGRRIVVSLLPGDILAFREERTRREYVLSIPGAYVYAVQLEVARRKRERIEARKAKHKQ
jgi:hypothetical protein